MLSLWSHLEGDVLGDMVILPFVDGYRNLSLNFLGGTWWVMQRCPNLRHIVKLDGDRFVAPVRLKEYVLQHLAPDSRQLHCYVLSRNRVHHQEADSPVFVPVAAFPDNGYYTHCSGRSVLMTTPVLRDLCRWSRVLPAFSVDDAYVTGDLALSAGVGHVDMRDKIMWDRDRALYEVLGGCIVFVHVSGHSRVAILGGLWNL